LNKLSFPPLFINIKMQKVDILRSLGLPFMDAENQGDEEDLDEEEMDEEQKHKNWVQNRAFLYDHLLVHTLSAPTSTVQWLPRSEDAGANKKNYLVTGTTNTDKPNKNYIALYSVQLPKYKPTLDVAEEARAPPKDQPTDKRHTIKLEKKLAHTGDVNRLAYMPQDSDIIATRTDHGEVNLYKLDSTEAAGPFSVLKGLTASGFALNWSPKETGLLVSSGADGRIAVWDALNHPDTPTSVIEQYQVSVNVSQTLNSGR
jgi:histone-binding protein RBBP4